MSYLYKPLLVYINNGLYFELMYSSVALEMSNFCSIKLYLNIYLAFKTDERLNIENTMKSIALDF